MNETTDRASTGASRGPRVGPAAAAAIAWGLLTITMVAGPVLVYRLGGAAALRGIVQEGPISDLMLTLYAASAAWLLFGALLVLVALGRVTRGNALEVACFLLVCFLYIGFVRERVRYGDVTDYANAAMALAKGEHLPARYLYPPLWATLLKGLAPHGARVIFDVCWILNVVSLCALFPLLRATLARYGFSSRAAAVAAAAFMIANAPIARTLGYVQINFHVLNLLLGGLLLLRSSTALSALAVALAVHLKAAPLALVPAFVIARRWRWLGWFALWAVVVAALTIVENGLYPWRDFLANARGVWAYEEPSYRQFSIDSFVQAMLWRMGAGFGALRYVVGPVKIALAALGLAVVLGNVSWRTFRRAGDAEDAVWNAAPALFAIMILLQPIAWPHHCVFLAVPFLVILKRIETPAEWLVWGASYVVVFLAPVHDFFPWSYGRLAALLAWLFLAWRVSRRADDSPFFAAAVERLGSLSARSGAG